MLSFKPTSYEERRQRHLAHLRESEVAFGFDRLQRWLSARDAARAPRSLLSRRVPWYIRCAALSSVGLILAVTAFALLGEPLLGLGVGVFLFLGTLAQQSMWYWPLPELRTPNTIGSLLWVLSVFFTAAAIIFGLVYVVFLKVLV